MNSIDFGIFFKILSQFNSADIYSLPPPPLRHLQQGRELERGRQLVELEPQPPAQNKHLKQQAAD